MGGYFLDFSPLPVFLEGERDRARQALCAVPPDRVSPDPVSPRIPMHLIDELARWGLELLDDSVHDKGDVAL